MVKWFPMNASSVVLQSFMEVRVLDAQKDMPAFSTHNITGLCFLTRGAVANPVHVDP